MLVFGELRGSVSDIDKTRTVHKLYSYTGVVLCYAVSTALWLIKIVSQH